ncbi:DNA primase [Pseudoruegeria sp. SHC-113]|uniref:DNA primase n=1 Tax=Pseudoruegeria sp. SHC-113 TaxID=2855439 RepID=UPI0021BB571F|nr:DNA primase [Pseudoruegeria sp. SHC-113]MCT8161506.1 DNA primase [Pseudoruegeria sp. SHC-113]
MSLPPGFLDELRTRVSLSQVVGRKVMWDARKSNQGKGDMWAPCPFHQEKSASFHVDDRKGYYYCFGCHAKGDAISFVRETENVDFMEAVRILAGEAGMQMPARDPQAQKKADRRTQLAEVMEQAVQFFRLNLAAGGGFAAREYLDQRGMAQATRERFEIGFAPAGWQGLYDHLRGKNVPEELIIGAGLAKASNKGGKPYDVFRNRIIFPIRDARGRCIAFGGRAMDPTDNAKYLNSPETELFDKGRSLYNHAPAREAAGKGQTLVVAEGYMDVIALSVAGFGATVAPLGTAITEDQLRLLWRIAPEPIIALDGDSAGLRAARRVIDLALPLLESGNSLRFAILPEGQDPDDLIKAKGPDAMQAVLDGARPMVSLLWERETEGQVFDSPERRAALDKRLRAAVSLIRDPSIRGHYGEEIKRMRQELFFPQRPRAQWSGGSGGKGSWRARGTPEPVRASTKHSLLVTADPATEDRLREAVILASLVLHPDVLARFESALEMLEFSDPDHARIRDVLLRAHPASSDAAKEAIATALGPDALENLFAPRHVQISPTVRTPGDTTIAAMCVAEAMAKLKARRGAQREIAEAMEDLTGVADEGLTWRLQQAAEALNRAERSETEDTTEYETGSNGALVSREERETFDKLLQGIKYTKGKG